ncbi:MAG: LysE family translocator [Rhodospirillales bacterium]
MIPLESLALFIATVTALIISPGPDTLNVLRHSLSGGRGLGLAAVTGVQFGLLGHTALAVLGISALIASVPAALKAVALIGAAYLAWLGIQGFRDSGVVRLKSTPAPAGKADAARAFREACLVNLLNPKVIMLYLALYPNFIDTGRGDVGAQLIFLSAVMIAINTVWQSGLVFAVNPIRRLLADPRAGRAVNRGAGVLLLAFAALMIADHIF